MSTYYSFLCTECRLAGGHMSEQMWGIGNADLIDTFKFVMHHGTKCGPANIKMVSEHQWERDKFEDTNLEGNGRAVRKKHLEDTADIFPRSNDWDFMRDAAEGVDLRKQWVEQELARNEEAP